MSLLDEWFPRNKKPQRETQPEHGAIDAPLRWTGIEPEPRKTKRDPDRITAKQLERIGEGLTRDVLAKFDISLSKIPLVEGYYGYTSIDVDFQGAWDGHPLKVEAKTWWIARNSFPLSRISKNERGYLRRGLRDGFNCWLTFALLRDEPKRSACNELYVIPWGDWLFIESQLQERASGNFKGASLRECDLDLLDGYALLRDGRQWIIPEGHWLSEDGLSCDELLDEPMRELCANDCH